MPSVPKNNYRENQGQQTRCYGQYLLGTLPLKTDEQKTNSAYSFKPLQDWANSGLMFLIKGNDTPALTNNIIPSCANQALQTLRDISGQNILPGIQGSSLLSERAAYFNFSAPTQASANGSCHLFACNNDEYIVLNLARESDWFSLPALLQQKIDVTPFDSALIKQLRKILSQCSAEKIVEQGRMLDMAIAQVPQISGPPNIENWYSIHTPGERCSPTKKPPLVVDLSSLWAGPLCSHLLQLCGARVLKVESTQRPDGARINPLQEGQAFFQALNNNKEFITFDFSTDSGIQELKALLDKADIVIEGSRPRALQQLGIDAEQWVQNKPGAIWLSITGYGRQSPYNNYVAFGDDAAASAGLIHWQHNKPSFIGDAIADPLTGIHAALAVWAFWQSGQGALLDINLHTISAFCHTYAALDDFYPNEHYKVTQKQQQYFIEHDNTQTLIQAPRTRGAL